MVVVGLVLLAIGGWKVVLWGIFLRVTLGLHATWFVNSATHMWGSKRFETATTRATSGGLPRGGEGWHNNHHAHPLSARHGLAWYEVDFNWYRISALKSVGLIWDVKLPKLREARIKAVNETPVASEEQLAPAYGGD